MTRHTVGRIGSGEYSCSCGAVWDYADGPECPAQLGNRLHAEAQEAIENSVVKCRTCNDSGVVSTTDKDHNGDHIERRCPVCAGRVDERAAFDEWFCKRHSYKPGTDTTQLSAAFEPFKAWQARAALSAPSHGEQVREVVPEEWQTMLSRVVDELDSLNCSMRDQIDSDMAEPDEEAELCDATDELIDEARALIATAPSAGSQGGDV